jgi:ribonuclease BN (tRNA processing enzyme)
MKIEILGCYGNHVDNYRTTSFLLNDSILLDAGTITEILSEERLKKITHVVVSHTHIDHLKGLFPFVDELVMMGEHSIELISVKQIIEIISQNLFNNLIWPDFTVIPSENNAVIRFCEIDLEKTTSLGTDMSRTMAGKDGISIKPVLMTHTVYTVGFVVKEGKKGFMFTADTGPTERFWEVAKEEKGIEFIIADVSFPNRHEKLAKISGHMTLSMLFEHLDKYGLNKKLIYITHIKPIFKNEILAELEKSKRKNIKPLVQGGILTI